MKKIFIEFKDNEFIDGYGMKRSLADMLKLCFYENNEDISNEIIKIECDEDTAKEIAESYKVIKKLTGNY